MTVMRCCCDFLSIVEIFVCLFLSLYGAHSAAVHRLTVTDPEILVPVVSGTVLLLAILIGAGFYWRYRKWKTRVPANTTPSGGGESGEVQNGEEKVNPVDKVLPTSLPWQYIHTNPPILVSCEHRQGTPASEPCRAYVDTLQALNQHIESESRGDSVDDIAVAGKEIVGVEAKEYEADQRIQKATTYVLSNVLNKNVLEKIVRSAEKQQVVDKTKEESGKYEANSDESEEGAVSLGTSLVGSVSDMSTSSDVSLTLPTHTYPKVSAVDSETLLRLRREISSYCVTKARLALEQSRDGEVGDGEVDGAEGEGQVDDQHTRQQKRASSVDTFRRPSLSDRIKFMSSISSDLTNPFPTYELTRSVSVSSSVQTDWM